MINDQMKDYLDNDTLEAFIALYRPGQKIREVPKLLERVAV